jgi:SagB-type dehydrogenase family enzyme
MSRGRFIGLGAAGLVMLGTRTARAGAAKEVTAPVREAIRRRRTVRAFSGRGITRFHLLELLWAAQGVTDTGGRLRAAPSAGALYPLEVHAVTGPGVEGVAPGVHHYRPAGGSLEPTVPGRDLRRDLSDACLRQGWMAEAPVSLVISSVHSRTTAKYGGRGVAYALIEAGCAAENVFLLAGGMGLGAGIVGAFDDEAVARLIALSPDARPLLVMPVGYRR